MSNLHDPNEPMENNDRKSKMDKFFEEMQRKIDAQEAEIEAMKKQLNEQNKAKEQPPKTTPVEETPMFEKETFSNDFDLSKEETPVNTSSFFDDLKEELNPYMDKAKELLGGVEEKAKEAYTKFDKYTDKLHDKLKKEDEEYEKKKASRPKFHTTGDSLFKGTEGLFDKAKKFMDKAEKMEEMKSNPPSDEVKIIKNTGRKKKSGDDNDTVYGFEDLDGDGDPIIDDAIIED